MSGTLQGIVRERLPNGRYRVEVEGGRFMEVHLPGEEAVGLVKVRPGDRVCVEASPRDPDKGRITREQP